MKIIVVGSAKGGVGKTTVSAALAVQASLAGVKVALADFDPLQCLSRWHDTRESAVPILLGTQDDVAEALKEAEQAGVDILIFDSAPGAITKLRELVDVADILVIPTRASPIDVQTLDPAIELARFSGSDILVVLNATFAGSDMTTGARAYLSTRKVPVWSDELALSESHAAAMITGKTATESGDTGAGREIKALWMEISKILKARHKR